jgi:phosphate transport system protein
MSRYEERLAKDKAHIRERVVAVGEKVDLAVADAVDALLAGDEARLYRIVLGDLPVNREIRAIDKLCHAFVARHLPSAGHLRFVSSVLQMNVALERIGDYAVSIAREAVQLEKPPSDELGQAMRALSDKACAMLGQAMSAFSTKDAELARKTKPLAKGLEKSYGQIYRELTSGASGREVKDIVVLLAVFAKVERVSDQAKNICEETLFELTGETKPAKQYSVLFVDTRNTLIAPLAESLARKAFPESGVYDSAGFKIGDALAPELIELAQNRGLDLAGIEPTALDTKRDALEKYHVIVCLSPEARRHITQMPYATVLLEWTLPKLADAGDGGVSHQLELICNTLADEIRELMVIMRGEEAT